MLTDRIIWSHPGSAVNEDAVGGGCKYLFVIDGATGLSGHNVMGSGSNAQWLTQYTAAQLRRRLPEETASIAEILEETMAALCTQWRGTPEEVPSAGIAVWRQRGAQLEYFGLGDCSASLVRKDGSVECFQETRLTALDQQVLVEMQRLCRSGACTMQDARSQVTAQLIRNRNLRNTEAGYWCLDPSGKGIPHARTAAFPLGECCSVFACSDGYEQLIAFHLAKSLPTLHALTLERGAETMAAELFAAQEADADCTRVPRFKKRDDTSAAAARCIAETERRDED